MSVEAQINGIRVLTRGTSERPPAPSTMTQQEVGSLQHGRGLSANLTMLMSWPWTSSLKSCEKNRCLLFISHPVDGIVSLQPRWTGTGVSLGGLLRESLNDKVGLMDRFLGISLTWGTWYVLGPQNLVMFERNGISIYNQGVEKKILTVRGNPQWSWFQEHFLDLKEGFPHWKGLFQHSGWKETHSKASPGELSRTLGTKENEI